MDKTELTTLKDITIHQVINNCRVEQDVVSYEVLKQEAIKWVKQHRNIKPNWAKETNEEFFMAFFNLTEEEIK
jgi:replication initiation and membrane attachment protein DnaB